MEWSMLRKPRLSKMARDDAVVWRGWVGFEAEQKEDYFPLVRRACSPQELVKLLIAVGVVLTPKSRMLSSNPSNGVAMGRNLKVSCESVSKLSVVPAQNSFAGGLDQGLRKIYCLFLQSRVGGYSTHIFCGSRFNIGSADTRSPARHP